MAEQKDAGAGKGGFFARRKERKESEMAVARAPPPKLTAQPPKPGASPARPAGAPVKPAPASAPVSRVSLESMPNIEKRIDSMAATERRQKLLERYEQKYGEKLDLPNVFVSIEDEKKAEAAQAADAMAGGKPIDEGKMAAVTGMAPPKPAAPPPKPAAPAKPGFFGSKPAPSPAAPPGAPAPAPARPAAPVMAAPAVPAPPLPQGMTMGRYMWPSVWPFWGFMVRRYAKYRYAGDSKKINMLTIFDLPLLVVMFIPRLIIFWPGLALWAYNYFKKKKATKAEPAAKEEAPTATN
jgi:hypothetical protein